MPGSPPWWAVLCHAPEAALPPWLDARRAADAGELAGPLEHDPCERADFPVARLAALGLGKVGAVGRGVEPADGPPGHVARRVGVPDVFLVVAGERVVCGVHSDRVGVVVVGEFRVFADGLLQRLAGPAPAAPLYNQVLVSGPQAGVSDPIIRTGTAGDVRMTNIVDPLITQHEVALERGRNALAAGIADRAQSNLWRSLRGLEPAAPQRKGNVTAVNPDGSYTIATADGATIRARPLPGTTWSVSDGVFVRDGVIVDDAPALESTMQYV